MTKWLSGIRGSILIVLLWIVGWGLGFGGLMELADPHGQFGDVWPPAMALPGFMGGLVFAGLLRVAERGRRLDEVALLHAAAWGGLTALVLAGIGISKLAGPISRVISHVALGMAAAFGAGSDQLRAPVAIGILTVLGMVAGVGTTVFLRLLARRRTPAVADPRA